MDLSGFLKKEDKIEYIWMRCVKMPLSGGLKICGRKAITLQAHPYFSPDLIEDLKRGKKCSTVNTNIR